jgi:bifunctional DNA-binding transcriptional regulator/antitoxin component of YhaV-PrlF toxin-antitoxin module
MPKAHIRNGNLMIPLSEKIRETLELHEGDEMEAYIFSGSVVSRKASGTRRTWRASWAAGWQVIWRWSHGSQIIITLILTAIAIAGVLRSTKI